MFTKVELSDVALEDNFSVHDQLDNVPVVNLVQKELVTIDGEDICGTVIHAYLT